MSYRGFEITQNDNGDYQFTDRGISHARKTVEELMRHIDTIMDGADVFKATGGKINSVFKAGVKYPAVEVHVHCTHDGNNWVKIASLSEINRFAQFRVLEPTTGTMLDVKRSMLTEIWCGKPTLFPVLTIYAFVTDEQYAKLQDTTKGKEIGSFYGDPALDALDQATGEMLRESPPIKDFAGLPKIPELLRDWPTPWKRNHRDIVAANEGWILDCRNEALGDKIVELANYAGEMMRIAKIKAAVLRETDSIQSSTVSEKPDRRATSSLDRETFMRLMAEFINASKRSSDGFCVATLQMAFEDMFGTTAEKFK